MSQGLKWRGQVSWLQENDAFLKYTKGNKWTRKKMVVVIDTIKLLMHKAKINQKMKGEKNRDI